MNSLPESQQLLIGAFLGKGVLATLDRTSKHFFGLAKTLERQSRRGIPPNNTYKWNLLHSWNEQPAVSGDYQQAWYRNSKLHRDADLPAVVYKSGTQMWYQNGLLHRDGDQPAVVNNDGSQLWYQGGRLHRLGDKPAVIHADGSLFWHKNGLQFRQGDLPTEVLSSGTKRWYLPNLVLLPSGYHVQPQHREVGPAVIHPNGDREYWYLGKRVYPLGEEGFEEFHWVFA